MFHQNQIPLPVRPLPLSGKPAGDVAWLFVLLHRHWRLIAGVSAASVGAGLLFILMTPPMFTATADIEIEPTHVAEPDNGPNRNTPAQTGVDPVAVDSQVELLRSEALARAVIRTLHLTDVPEFRSGRGFLSTLWSSGPSDEVDYVPPQTLRAFMARLDVRRIKDTYVIAVRFRSRDAALATAVVNTLIQSHFDSRASARRDAIKREGEWLTDRLVALRARIADADKDLKQAASAGSSQGSLAQQQRSIDAYRAVFQTFLERQTLLSQQLTYPFGPELTFAPARSTGEKTYPNNGLVVLLSVIAGLATGVGLATAIEFRNRGLASVQSLEGVLGASVISAVPMLLRPERAPPLRRGYGFEQLILLRSLLGRARHALRPTKPRHTLADVSGAQSPGGQRDAAKKPLSRFTEAVRALRVRVEAAVPRSGVCAIGVVATCPGEGTSTIAMNLASSLACRGRGVLLIDGNHHHPQLSRRYRFDVDGGSTDDGVEPLPAAPVRLREGLDFLRGDSTDSDDRALASRLGVLSERASYDFVVVDLPPLGLSDANALAAVLQRFVLVSEYHKTPVRLIVDALNTAPSIREKLVGVVVNKVDVKRAALTPTGFESPCAASYFQD